MQDKLRRGRARGISGASQFLAPPPEPEAAAVALRWEPACWSGLGGGLPAW
jgi:hypothetical protein